MEEIKKNQDYYSAFYKHYPIIKLDINHYTTNILHYKLTNYLEVPLNTEIKIIDSSIQYKKIMYF